MKPGSGSSGAKRPFGNRPRRAQPKSLAEILVKEYPAPKEWPMIRAFAAWSRGLPKRVVDNARPVSLERGVLLVHVTNPMWAQELTYLAPAILERIAKEPGAASVRQMRFRVAKLPDPIPLDGQIFDPMIRGIPPVPSDMILEAALTTIADEALRKAVEGAATAGRARRAYDAKRGR